MMNSLHSIKRRRDWPATALGPLCVAVAIGLTGCDDPSADLQTRLTYSQKELESANAEIQKLRADVGKPPEQSAEASRRVASEELPGVRAQ